jgi:hypothetical protein
MLSEFETELPVQAGVVHVAPDPRGGWLVEADGCIIASYDTLGAAKVEAYAYAAHKRARVIVHDRTQPAAGVAAAS